MVFHFELFFGCLSLIEFIYDSTLAIEMLCFVMQDMPTAIGNVGCQAIMRQASSE